MITSKFFSGASPTTSSAANSTLNVALSLIVTFFKTRVVSAWIVALLSTGVISPESGDLRTRRTVPLFQRTPTSLVPV